MKTYKLAEVHAAFKAQGVSSHRHYAVKCPICGTVQSMASLVASGDNPDKVDRHFAFSCEGRFSGAGEWPRDKKAQAARTKRGCNWTLGGLLQLHQAEVEYEDGEKSPMFDIALERVAEKIAAAIRADVDAERERCAKVASDYIEATGTIYMAERVSAAIRPPSGSGEPEKSCTTCSKGPRKAKCPTFRAIDCSELNGYPGWEAAQEQSPEQDTLAAGFAQMVEGDQKDAAITEYYTDRAKSGQSPLAK